MTEKSPPGPTSEEAAGTASSLFRPGPLERLSHPVQLDALLVVVTPRMWIALLCLIMLLGGLIGWSVFGSLPVTVHGRGIVMNQKGRLLTINTPVGGLMQNITVKPGQEVKAGQLMAEMADPERQMPLHRLTSPIDGKVLELLAGEGETLTPGSPVVWLEYSNAGHAPYRVYAYFPLAQGKRLAVGTAAYVAVSTIDTQEYGYLQGKVSEVSGFAIPQAGLEKQIYNKELVEYLAPGDEAVIEATIELDIDPHTHDYRLTSGKSLPSPLTTGTVGTVQATIHRIRPLYYMLPLESLKLESVKDE